MSARPYARIACVVLLSVLAAGAKEKEPTVSRFDSKTLLVDPRPEDEIFNLGLSAPIVSFSLIQGGLSAGTVDGGNNQDQDAGLQDLFGSDKAIGSEDDLLSPSPTSALIDAGSNAALPADRFDLDGDGDVQEPLPFDRAGSQRTFDSNAGIPTVDIGAYEYGPGGSVGIERDDKAPGVLTLSSPYPNPSTSELFVDFSIPKTAYFRLTLYDLLGREVRSVREDVATGGVTYQTLIETSRLSSATYFIKLEVGNDSVVRQFVVAR